MVHLFYVFLHINKYHIILYIILTFICRVFVYHFTGGTMQFSGIKIIFPKVLNYDHTKSVQQFKFGQVTSELLSHL